MGSPSFGSAVGRVSRSFAPSLSRPMRLSWCLCRTRRWCGRYKEGAAPAPRLAPPAATTRSAGASRRRTLPNLGEGFRMTFWERGACVRLTRGLRYQKTRRVQVGDSTRVRYRCPPSPCLGMRWVPAHPQSSLMLGTQALRKDVHAELYWCDHREIRNERYRVSEHLPEGKRTKASFCPVSL